ncbi:MAG: aminopeptidase P family protein [Candidatus Aminicenantes bacterium]|nr:aminopeptidase P family protein [Candidatus Aminicenantes bacterium]
MSLIREKVRQAVGLLAEFDVDCWVTFTRESGINGDPSLVFLAPGDVTWHSAFIISRDGRARAVVGRYDQRAIAETGAYDEVAAYVTGFREPLVEYLKSLAPAKIAVNYSKDSEICDGLTHGMFLTLEEVLAEAGLAGRMVSAERIVSALRERKTAAELDAIRRAVRAAEEIFGKVAGFIAPGRTEREIAAFMSAEVGARGLAPAWAAETCPAVFSGPDTAEAHYGPTGKVVAPGHVLNMDFGVMVDGYCSDLQRTFYIREQGETGAPPDVAKGFATILRTVEASMRAIRPGVTGFEVDAVARGIVVGAGYEEFPHALGHQVGRFAHDGTALLGPRWEKYARKPLQLLEEGMVFTIEPRLTVPGRGIVTIEEMVVVGGSGAEWLSTPQTDIWLV